MGIGSYELIGVPGVMTVQAFQVPPPTATTGKGPSYNTAIAIQVGGVLVTVVASGAFGEPITKIDGVQASQGNHFPGDLKVKIKAKNIIVMPKGPCPDYKFKITWKQMPRSCTGWFLSLFADIPEANAIDTGTSGLCTTSNVPAERVSSDVLFSPGDVQDLSGACFPAGITPETWDPTPETPADACAACGNGASLQQAEDACALITTSGTFFYDSCLLDFCYSCGSFSSLQSVLEAMYEIDDIPYEVTDDSITPENGTTIDMSFFGDALPATTVPVVFVDGAYSGHSGGGATTQTTDDGWMDEFFATSYPEESTWGYVSDNDGGSGISADTDNGQGGEFSAVLRSVQFILTGGTSISVDIVGGTGIQPSWGGIQAPTPAPAATWSANAGPTGFIGVAIRDVSTNTWMVSKKRSSNAWGNANSETVTFSTSELSPGMGSVVTIDLIDTYYGELSTGGYNGAIFDNVTICGTATSFADGFYSGIGSDCGSDGSEGGSDGSEGGSDGSEGGSAKKGSLFSFFVKVNGEAEWVYVDDIGSGTGSQGLQLAEGHDYGVLQSIEFTLTGSTSISIGTHGGTGGLADVDGLSTETMGFMGIAIRDVASDTWIISSRRTNNGAGAGGYEVLTFSSSDLAEHAGKVVTLDLIDSYSDGGSYDWITFNKATISGSATTTLPDGDYGSTLQLSNIFVTPLPGPDSGPGVEWGPSSSGGLAADTDQVITVQLSNGPSGFTGYDGTYEYNESSGTYSQGDGTIIQVGIMSTAHSTWAIVGTDESCTDTALTNDGGSQPSGVLASVAACEASCAENTACKYYLYTYDPNRNNANLIYHCATWATCGTTSTYQDGDGGQIYQKPVLSYVDTANLAVGLDATSPDGYSPDDTGGDADAAVDGDENTYFDQDNNQAGPYILQLTNTPSFAGYSLDGYANNEFAPKSWTLECDGTTIDTQTDHSYSDNLFTTGLTQTFSCTTLQLVITDWYDDSPAIREFQLHPLADNWHEECRSSFGCEDDGANVCHGCGVHDGLSMYCCNSAHSFSSGHACFESEFLALTQQAGHHCVTPQATTPALPSELCPVSAETSDSGSWSGHPSTPATKYGTNQYIFVVHLGGNVAMVMVDKYGKYVESGYRLAEGIDIYDQAAVVAAWDAKSGGYSYDGKLSNMLFGLCLPDIAALPNTAYLGTTDATYFMAPCGQSGCNTVDPPLTGWICIHPSCATGDSATLEEQEYNAVLRSVPFYLGTGGTVLKIDAIGGNGGTDNVDDTAATWGDYTTSDGFQGVAIRNVETDTWVVSKRRSSSSLESWETLEFTVYDLAPLAGLLITVDLLDLYTGSISFGEVIKETTTLPPTPVPTPAPDWTSSTGTSGVTSSTGTSDTTGTSSTGISTTDTSTTDTSATGTSSTGTSATDTSATGTSSTGTSATGTSSTGTSVTATSMTGTDTATMSSVTGRVCPATRQLPVTAQNLEMISNLGFRPAWCTNR
jgi:hypothetical protein